MRAGAVQLLMIVISFSQNIILFLVASLGVVQPSG